MLTQDYYAFGADYNASASGNVYKFNAKPLEAVGLYYYGARYYDQVIGRFISCDPVMGRLDNIQIQ
ncbi:MAG: RHS repeat-associated core domain-containing protein [Candidatus Edwardsbacteria bacterium]